MPRHLLGMRAIRENHLAQQLHRRAKLRRLRNDPLDRPVGVMSMARRHVIVDGGVAAVTGAALVGRDPFAGGEDLDGPRRQPTRQLATGRTGEAYAATIHKSQGVTVDRAHVLATPGLDRHAAYVALSRHRSSVELHYGQDDFADQDRLVHTLGRERSKDMASDYDKPFADRRQSVGAAEKSVSREPPKRNLFAGLARHLEKMAVERPPANEIAPTPVKAKEPVPDLSAAVSRHGRIVHAIRFARSVGDPASPEQKAELAGSRAALDRITPNGSMDLETAFSVDRGLIAEASAGRTTAVIRAMQLEAEMRDNPHLRADTFVQRWQSLERQRRLLVRDHEDSRADQRHPGHGRDGEGPRTGSAG
jgi:hypothetical protein